MSKNTEIIAEIISEEVGKLDKLVSKQSEFVQEFSSTMQRAEKISIKTERLEEVIEHWNNLFDKQKDQIKLLQSKQIIENRIHRAITYLLLAIVIILLILKNI
jgi:archaellum biogenesis protein FlaJ (TadC family)